MYHDDVVPNAYDCVCSLGLTLINLKLSRFGDTFFYDLAPAANGGAL